MTTDREEAPLDGSVCVLIKTTYRGEFDRAEWTAIDGECAGVFSSRERAEEYAISQGAARLNPLGDHFATCRIITASEGYGIPEAMESTVYTFDERALDGDGR